MAANRSSVDNRDYLGSVIIPAHNEEAVIGRLLAELGSVIGNRQFEVIVACNGCTDKTFHIASSFGGNIRALNLDDASKTAALNAGDAAATCFPRLYLDADIDIGLPALQRIVGAMAADPRLMLASTIAEYDLGHSSWIVRQYYRIWTELPYVKNTRMLGGSGLYALSAAGHQRLGRFPDVISDDGYVNTLFSQDEKRQVAGAASRVYPPASLGALVRAKSRIYRGNQELRRLGKLADGKSNSFGDILQVARQGRGELLIPAAVYIAVTTLVRLAAATSGTRGMTWRPDRDYGTTATKED